VRCVKVWQLSRGEDRYVKVRFGLLGQVWQGDVSWVTVGFIIIFNAESMRKIKNIITGWFLLIIFWDSKQAKERRAICKTCPERITVFCGSCGCPIAAKSRVEEEMCPLNKWAPLP